MGAAESIQTNEMNSDPWWSPHSSQRSQSNELEHGATEVNTGNEDNEAVAVGQELWLKQIQDLGKVIQNLASENIKLLDSNKELKQKCEEQERKLKEKVDSNAQTEKEYCRDMQIVKHSHEEAVNDKRLIEDLKQQLQINTKNSAVEVEKYHENLNFMRMKVKEYEQVVEKLERDAAVQNDAMQSLQYTLRTEDQKKESESVDLKVVIETLKQDYKICQAENKALKEQFETERNMRRKTDEENQKLLEELKQIKQKDNLNIMQRTSESSDADTSEGDASKENNHFPVTSDLNGNGEARTLSPRAAAELEVFQKQLKTKREARHKALSAISMEMERLRKELNTEREVRRNAVRELENARSMSDTYETFEEVNDLKQKLTSECQEKDRIYKEMIEIQKQGNEEIESILRELEKEKAKTQQVLEENKFIKEQLEESDQMLQLRSHENNELQNKLETDREKHQQQVLALKDVVAISKEMLTVRENQVTHLKQTLQDIEASVIEKHRGSLTAGLRAEYETQMENIKALKALYEERTQVVNAEKERLISEQKELQRLIENEKRIVEDLEVKLQEKEDIISERNTTVSDLQDQLSEAIDQSRNLSYELTLINNMFTQILGSNDMDLDRLTKLLQENHDLITEITTKGDCSETTASLPKMLLDLVCHAENAESNSDVKNQQDPNDISSQVASTTEACAMNEEKEESASQMVSVNSNGAHLAMQDISSNLPKVWKVLLELVSHHVPSPSEESSSEDSKTSCYKSIDTPYGPKNVISVSKTFIRLRDLILQKKTLQKEVTRLKQLNVHLETKLNDQERRLSLVSTELRKTWNVVDHMRVQHQQLHTHEKVLRYELQQKRKLLNELKEELEYCREKWEDARQKNSQSETEWQKLRKEFALRKNIPLNNSGESGFSEEKDEEGSDNDLTKVQGQLCQTKSKSDDLNNLPHAICIDQTVINPGDSETVNASATSLPDLVSATTDLPLPPSEVHISIGTISSHGIPSPHLQNIVQENISLENANNESVVLEQSVLEECPTVSLVTLLKQQLSCFSRNLNVITAELDSNDHFKALQSIFSLPAIQIPEHLNTSTDEPSTSCLQIKCNADSANEMTVDQRTHCTKEGHEHTVRRKDSPERTFSQNYMENDAIQLEEQEKIILDSLETSSLSSSISQTFNTENHENHVLHTTPVESTEEPGRLPKTDEQSSKESSKEESKTERLQRLQRQCQELFDKVVTGKSDSRSNTVHTAEQKEETKSQNGSCESTRESTKDLENMLDARQARLKRLEEQSQQLFKKVKRTTNRSVALSNRLEELHEQYGTDDTTISETSPQRMPIDPCSSKSIDSPVFPDDHAPSQLQTLDNSCCSSTSLAPPSTSTHIPSSAAVQDMCDINAARQERLEQSQQLKKDQKITYHHAESIGNELEELHGSDDATENTIAPESTCSDSSLSNVPKPPPLPDYLVPSVSQTLKKPFKNTCVRENETHSPIPSTSATDMSIPLSIEDVLDARAARLKRLEEQSQQLFKKVKRTTNRSAELSNRLEVLHEQYGTDYTTVNAAHSSTSTESPSPSDSCIESSLSLSISSNHIPSPPPLPSALPSVRLPTEMDELNTRHDNKDTDEAKEQR